MLLNLLIAQIYCEHHAVCGAVVDYARLRRISCIRVVTSTAAYVRGLV